MKNIYRKYQGKSIEDTGSTTSKEFKQFCSCFKRRLKVNAEARGMELVDLTPGHYDFFGFLKREDKYVYFSYGLDRNHWSGTTPIDFKKKDCYDGFLLRTASNEKDYRGGRNHFTNLDGFMDKADELLNTEHRPMY